jgi:predicted metal-dependent hydrolase
MLNIKYREKGSDNEWIEKTVADQEYLDMYNHTKEDPELGFNVPVWEIEILKRLPDPEPEPTEEDLVLEVIQKHLELHEACGHYGAIYENVLKELKEKDLWDEVKSTKDE